MSTVQDREQDHDACSVGSVVSIDGSARRDVVLKALTALGTTIHRTGIAADGKTGDGAGIQTQIPQKLFQAEYSRIKGTQASAELGVGMFFLPRENRAARQRCREIISEELAAAGYGDFAWRKVPVDSDVLGFEAQQNQPHIEQLLIDKKNGTSDEKFELDLYAARRRIEKRIQEEGLSGTGSEAFYIPSLSGQSVVYKGMSLSTDLSELYPDLQHDNFESAYAIFHGRFSTNTAPMWPLAHPYRFLAHNGEVNTVIGNRNAMALHARRFAEALGEEYTDVLPIIEPGRSDSADVDAAIEFYRRAGLSLPAIKSMMVPEAVRENSEMSEAVREMYEYIDAVYEPWDGPATLIMSDGNMVLVSGDRNGLRPIRYVVTEDGLLVVGSEDGMARLDPGKEIKKGQLDPGAMLAADLQEKRLVHDEELKERAAAELAEERALVGRIRDIGHGDGAYEYTFSPGDTALRDRQRLAGYSTAILKDIIDPAVREGKEALGAMGDDTPLAVLSKKFRPLSDFFYQLFAQVTNPPLDSIREREGMSLTTHLGSFYDVNGQPAEGDVLRLKTPILSNQLYAEVLQAFGGNVCEIDCTYDINGGEHAMRDALNRIRSEAEAAARRGQHIVLTDEHVSMDRASVPMVLASAGVHTHLVNEGLRKQTSINVRSAECHEVHNTACLIGMGADTVNPYLAEETIAARHAEGKYDKAGKRGDLQESLDKYYSSLENGLLKIMGKMGVSPVSSYRMARLFECIGLSQDVMDEFMPGVQSPVGGLTLAQLQKRATRHHKRSVNRAGKATLTTGGEYAWRSDGEAHADTGPVIKKLQHAVAKGGDEGYAMYKEYTRMLEENAEEDPIRLRHLLKVKEVVEPVPLDEVESEDEILQRMMSGAMSIGALSPEAHDVIAHAMNRLGARSNSGEGGAREEFYGTDHDTKVKQWATGRFGVDAAYLANCEEIEIKIAQGAKPGEGGQLMGYKVYGLIPKLRNCEPGTTLISPPPHHDLYSIEDLQQMIYDLKQINPNAKVRVKLVSTTGIAPIAAGVEKCGADVIHTAGGDGGTGASPKSSIKHAGLPWEIGLPRVNKILTKNGAREKTSLSADGGLRQGLDVLMAALMGAEEYSFGTLLMESTGCLLMRQCHSNKCAVGVATQDERLREHFPILDGIKIPPEKAEEMVMNTMRYVARDIREQLAALGLRSLDEAIGRVDLLEQIRGKDLGIDLDELLQPSNPGGAPQRNRTPKGQRKELRHPKHPDRLTVDERFLEAHKEDILNGRPCEFSAEVNNEDRAIGARIAHHVVKAFGTRGLAKDTIKLNFNGVAGQSFGAFAVQGMTLNLTGGANDYVGKALSGGTIVIKPSEESPLAGETDQNSIMGNVCLIGATGGELYAAGRAGNRFAVRNSGADAVVEGMGDNGCNYMTAGSVVSLGEIGHNFGAGMTGGEAFVYDPSGKTKKRAHDDVRVTDVDGMAAKRLKARVEQYARRTGSLHARRLLDDWENALDNFQHVTPDSPPPPPGDPVMERTPAFAA